MIILGWIGVLLLIIGMATIFCREEYETYRESFINCCKAFVMLVGFLVFLWLVFILGVATLKKEHKPKVNTPTILVCNNITVAESINGFYYSHKSGAYEDYRNNLTYTPRQGEVCKEYLKGNE